MKKLIASLGVLLFLLSSCMKDSAFEDRLDADNPSNGMAVLAVFNMVESSDQLHVFLNNDILNKVGETLTYGEMLRHRTVLPGKRTLKVEVRYGSNVENSTPKEITLEQGKNYSLFLYGNNANGMVLVEDNLLLPQQGKFKVRFANFNRSQDASSVGNKAEKSKYFSAIVANNVTDFITLDTKENDFVLNGVGQKTGGFAIQLNPLDRGVYTVLITAPRFDVSSGNTRQLYKVVQHP